MESITNAAEEVLVDALSFELPGSGQYVQERRAVTFHPEGSNAYSAQAGTRVIRFKLATEGWLDPGTVRISQAEGFGYDRPVEELNTLALIPGIMRFQTVCVSPYATAP